MRITKINIQNFRSLRALELEVEELAAICGPNSCGKSNVLRAIRFAFLSTYDPARMQDNLCNRVTSPNAACKVVLTFDQATAELVRVPNVPQTGRFTYTVSVKRNGQVTAAINGVRVNPDVRRQFVEGFLIVHVPPIRDIAADGLDPFKATLAHALRSTRGTRSFPQLAADVRSAVEEKGQLLLGNARNLARDMLRVDELAVDASGLDLEPLLLNASLRVRVDGYNIGLDKLGTGHQSSVIIQLYRQLGTNSQKCVIYLFEEPDNHLHPTSMRVIATALHECAREGDSQVFLTTHSPHLINQFKLTEIVALQSTSENGTKRRARNIKSSERDIRIALGKFGLSPAEALLAQKVVVVEGPNDVTVLRALIRMKTGQSVDQLDYLVIPAGGKGQVADLCQFLEQLGVFWWAVFDKDAGDSTHVPHFKDGMSPQESTAATAAIATLMPLLNSLPTKRTAAEKLVDAMAAQLATPPARGQVYEDSVLERFLTATRILNQQQRNLLKGAIACGQPNVIKNILTPVRVLLWQGAIEEVVAHTAPAVADVEKILRSEGIITQEFTNNIDRRKAILKELKKLAHEPSVMEGIIEQLWANGRFNRSDAKAAVKSLTE